MSYTLGIDIGIASVGFAGVDPKNSRIQFCGAHIFDTAERPKDGASLALPRREKRALRRIIRRRTVRKNDIRKLLLQHEFQNISEIDASRQQKKTGPNNPPVNPWDLRREAITRKLEDGEFARVLFHIAKRRGFQSNRKEAGPNDLEGKKALSGAVALQEAMTREGLLTVGEFLSTLPKKRNGDGTYERFVTRNLLREEVKIIFEAQRKHRNAKAAPAFQKAYEDIAFFQRPLRSSEGLVGYCSLEPDERRAPKFSYSAELFILWSKLNNLRVKSLSGNERPLSQDEKNRLANKAHALSSVSYKQARKELGLSEDERFNISYRKTKEDDNTWEKVRDRTEDSKFLKLPGYHALRDILGTKTSEWHRWLGKDQDKLDEISRILSFYEDEKEIDNLLSPIVPDAKERKALSAITTFSKTVDHSLKAIRKMLPHMQSGLTYDKACEAAGYKFSRKDCAGLVKLPKFDDVRNPVVNRALAQARKVINAVIGRFGIPESIIVELARDVGRNFKDRKDIERQQKKNEDNKKEARKHVEEEILDGRTANGEDILKFRLWKEQDAFCPYCGAEITPMHLRDEMATQIDHILPYSRSWDDGYMNKIVCHTGCNQEKGNRTPFEWLGATSRWEGLQAMARNLPARKSEKLLMEKFDDDKAGEWKERNLNDTRFMAKLLKNHIQRNLALKNGVQARNGALTAHLRRSWGFPDKKRTNDRHHALDAIVLACSTQSMVQRLSSWNKYEARKKAPQTKPLPPKPWETFREEAMAAIYGVKNPDTDRREGGIFVSRMPCRKITGAAHEETIRSIRWTSDGQRQIIQRIKLKALTLPVLENLVDKKRNIHLYTLLKERLESFDGKPDKAFAAPIYMPTNKPGTQGPVINSVRVLTGEKSGVEVQGGLASNGDMVRVDVFGKMDSKGKMKYYLVPLYAHHFAAKQLPCKAIVANKDEDNWEPVEEKDFLFSLYKNDFVRLVGSKDTFLGYYVGTHRGTGAINIKAHDGDPSFGNNGIKTGIGARTLKAVEKYSVDYFGNLNRIHKEPRLGLACTSHSESGEADD